MYKILLSLLFPLMLLSTDACAQHSRVKQITWTTAAELRNRDGSTSLGFAGPINAILKEGMIVAGGANFPDKMPWEGGAKRYSDEIHVLEKAGNVYQWNTAQRAKLPEAIAYCGNTTTPMGLVYAGGENEKGLSSKAYLLNWDGKKNQLLVTKLPDLSVAQTNMALTHIGNTVYAAGGDLKDTSSNAFMSLNLDDASPEWTSLPDLPVPLANAVVEVQEHNGKPHIYVIGGRTKTKSGISDLRSTVFAFDPAAKIWKTCRSISDDAGPINYSAGAGVSVGSRYILLLGGDTGETFHKIETYISKISATANAAEKEKLILEKKALTIHHQGFYKGILCYDTEADKWKKIGELPFPAQVTTTARMWGEQVVISSGEIKPGIRSPKIMIGTIK